MFKEFLDKDLYVYQTFLGQYDLKFCLKALAKRGVVKCDEVGNNIEVNVFSSDQCFNVFQQSDVTICWSNTNTHAIQHNDAVAMKACLESGHPCQVSRLFGKQQYMIGMAAIL